MRSKQILLRWGLVAFVFIAGVILGFNLKAVFRSAEDGPVQASEVKWWTCSMHPQIKQPRSGKCPICFMDLVPVVSEKDLGDSTAADSAVISLSEQAIKLMEIETALVERKFVETEVRMSGRIDYDETKIKNITAWTSGRIDRLFVDFTGMKVRKGDHMVYLYSPDLLSAQAEYLQAIKSFKDSQEYKSKLVRETIENTLLAAKEKLLLLGITEKQLEEIEKTQRPAEHLVIYAPTGGIVIEKHVAEGEYVETGSVVYTIADLSELWVKLDAYESDLVWLRYGQTVEFTTESLPGEIFEGIITFISPVVDSKTRTVKLRVNVGNPDDKLKPDMFVRAAVWSKIATAGKVIDETLAGKWICPMHPAVISDGEGECDICGMPLESAEELGYVTVDAEGEPPVVIPVTTALITGKRAVVYVKVPDKKRPTFEGREIVLGPRAGDYYIVAKGLTAGEEVVTKGNFKIDSALQIEAKPSMMSPEGGKMDHGHHH